MAASDPMTEITARKKLEEYRKIILKDKPSLSTGGISVDHVLNPSDRKDWQMIRYYTRINKAIKDEFRQGQSNELKNMFKTLQGEGERGFGHKVGQDWDKMLTKKIKNMKEIIEKMNSADFDGPQLLQTVKSIGYCKEEDLSDDEDEDEEEQEDDVASSLLEEIKNEFGIICLDSHFPLYGFMCKKATETSPNAVYLWQGEADAVGWYQDDYGASRYVIVEWKVLDILEFWAKNPDAYGKYLHQCLVYAKLLQLHLKLCYLPHILIVPISGATGRDIHPALFYDYPEKCKKMIESYEWSSTLPKPPQIIDGGRFPFKNLRKGIVDEDMPLTEFFAKNAKVRDLLKAFGWHSFEVV